MRVGAKVSGVGTSTGVGKSSSGPPSAGAQAVGAGDALVVSSSATFITTVQARIAKLPDIRASKVEKLRAKLESDDYHPDGEAVAEGLVRDYTPPSSEK